MTDLFEEDDKLQIIVATDTLMVGVDFMGVADVYILGLPQDPDEQVQKAG